MQVPHDSIPLHLRFNQLSSLLHYSSLAVAPVPLVRRRGPRPRRAHSVELDGLHPAFCPTTNVATNGWLRQMRGTGLEWRASA